MGLFSSRKKEALITQIPADVIGSVSAPARVAVPDAVIDTELSRQAEEAAVVEREEPTFTAEPAAAPAPEPEDRKSVV